MRLQSRMEHKGNRPSFWPDHQRLRIGEAGEGRNVTHQQKKLNEKSSGISRRFNIPISDETLSRRPSIVPRRDPETKYLLEGAKRWAAPAKRTVKPSDQCSALGGSRAF